MNTGRPEAQAAGEDPARAAQPDTPSLQNAGPPPPIPDHELLRRIGRGSYGEVWLARTVLGELRAVKVVYRDRFEHERPYEREFEGIRKFEPISRLHDSQVDILHVGRNDEAGCFYYVMELADDGGMQNEKCEIQNETTAKSTASDPARSILNLEFSILNYRPHTLKLDLHRRSRLPVDECLRIGLALTTAVQHLHEHGLVHRDIKPSNIIFVGGVPKLADIGLVASMDQTMSFVGTSGFLPPEGPGTPQADLYSLGKVLYEISTGRDRTDFPKLPPELIEGSARVPRAESGGPPDSRSTDFSSPKKDQVNKVFGEAPKTAREPRALPEMFDDPQRLLELNAVILKACAHDPRQRYQSAQELAADLALLQEGKSVRRARGHQLLRSRVKKASLGLVLLALVAAGVARLARPTPRNEAASDGPPSTNELANALCVKALLNLRADNFSAFPATYTNLHLALKLDPNCYRAYVGLLELRTVEVVPEIGIQKLEEMRAIASKLKELGPNLAPTFVAQAVVKWSEWDYPVSKEFAHQATQVDPNYGFGRLTYGFLLTQWGLCDEGRKELEAARRLVPSKVTLYRFLGHPYFVERKFTNAIAIYQEALTWEPHQIVAKLFIGLSYLGMNDYSNAIPYLEANELVQQTEKDKVKKRYDALRRAWQDGGPLGYWQEQWNQVDSEDFYRKGAVQLHLGNTNAAFYWLKKSFEAHEQNAAFDGPLNYLVFDPVWDGVRGDPRFQELLNKVGFTKVNPNLKR